MNRLGAETKGKVTRTCANTSAGNENSGEALLHGEREKINRKSEISKFNQSLHRL